MRNITLARIDDRLIHGQVLTQWLPSLRCNTVEVVDDAVRADAFLMQISTMAVPKGYTPLVHSVDEAAAYLQQPHEDEEILLLVKFPETIRRLAEKGVAFDALNVGGIGIRPGRENLYRNIAASPEEKDILRSLSKKGTRVYVQMVPSDAPIEIEKLL